MSHLRRSTISQNLAIISQIFGCWENKRDYRTITLYGVIRQAERKREENSSLVKSDRWNENNVEFLLRVRTVNTMGTILISWIIIQGTRTLRRYAYRVNVVDSLRDGHR